MSAQRAMRIDGNTKVIAHMGYPTHGFKAPLIYNPYFVAEQIPAVVVPLGCTSDAFPDLLNSFFKSSNALGALITMPHKVAVMSHLDEISITAKIAGACNAVKKNADGKLVGDMFDGQGFILGLQNRGFEFKDRSALVVGNGGVGSAIAASLAEAGIHHLRLFDLNSNLTESLAKRLSAHYPDMKLELGIGDPTGMDLAINATPLGMNDSDPLPMDVSNLSSSTYVGEVVMSKHITPFLKEAQDRGCPIQVGTDMLFEMIPAYLRFFELQTTTAQRLRSLAQIELTP